MNDPFHPIDQSPENDARGKDAGFHPKNTAQFELFIDEFIWPIPATYMQEDGTIDRALVAPGQPWGGHMMDLIAAANDPTIPESGDPYGIGPHPIYFTTGETGAGFFAQMIDNLLASGVWSNTLIMKWCDTEDLPNIWGAIFDLGNGAQKLPLEYDFLQHGLPDMVGEE